MTSANPVQIKKTLRKAIISTVLTKVVDAAPRRDSPECYRLETGNQLRMKPSGQIELVKGYGHGVFYALSKRAKYVCASCGSGLIAQDAPCFTCLEKQVAKYESELLSPLSQRVINKKKEQDKEEEKTGDEDTDN